MLNLEPLAAQYAQKMVADDAKGAENLITKSAAVLAEQGVYAFGLFLASRKKEELKQANTIDNAIRSLLEETRLADKNVKNFYAAIGDKRSHETEVEALRRLLLTKQLMEVALCYGRYHAKAQGGK